MNEKVYVFSAYGEDHNIILGKCNYTSNGSFAVLMIEVFDDGHEEDFGMLTVNIDDSDYYANKIDKQFIDTNNLTWLITEWLAKNNIATFTGHYGHSGFCDYPLFIFTDEAVSSMRRL